VPGPTIRVTGDTVESDQRRQATSIHWHGLHVPNDQDGVGGVAAEIERADVQHKFVAPHAGTFVYRPRDQQPR
jgi:FtsP/CotA-like multicopper oxidase with cupredoxin domain